MSACDTCRKPGACCRGIAISSDAWPGTVWADSWRENAVHELDKRVPGHPFVPALLILADDDPTYGTVRWDCKNLTAEGRCGDYDNRPNLCRDYEAGSDALCAEFVQSIKGIPIMVVRQ